MRPILFLLLSIFLSIMANSQKKLKQEVRSNSDTTFSTSEQKIYTKPASKNAVYEYLKTSVYKTSNRYSLMISIQTGRSNIFTISAGSRMDIQLANGETVSLACLSDNTSRGSNLAYGSFIYVSYRLNAEDIRLLKGSEVKSIKVQSSLGNLDYVIKEKFSDAIKEQLEKFD